MDRVFYIQLYHLEFDRAGRTVCYEPIPEVFRTEEEATNSLPNYYVVMAHGWLVLERPFIAAMGELVRKGGGRREALASRMGSSSKNSRRDPLHRRRLLHVREHPEPKDYVPNGQSTGGRHLPA